MARLLCAKDDRLSERINPLLEMAEAASSFQHRAEAAGESMAIEGAAAASDLEMSVLEMEKRLEALQEKPTVLQNTPPTRAESKTSEQSEKHKEVCKLLSGWKCAPSEWTSTPIGCLNGRVPDLTLKEG